MPSAWLRLLAAMIATRSGSAWDSRRSRVAEGATLTSYRPAVDIAGGGTSSPIAHLPPRERRRNNAGDAISQYANTPMDAHRNGALGEDVVLIPTYQFTTNANNGARSAASMSRMSGSITRRRRVANALSAQTWKKTKSSSPGIPTSAIRNVN